MLQLQQLAQPLLLVASIKLGTLVRLPVTNRRKVGTTSDHHAPYDLGYTRATMGSTTRSEPAKASESLKAVLSSDCSLQLDCTKLESLVIAEGWHATNNYDQSMHHFIILLDGNTKQSNYIVGLHD